MSIKRSARIWLWGHTARGFPVARLMMIFCLKTQYYCAGIPASLGPADGHHSADLSTTRYHQHPTTVLPRIFTLLEDAADYLRSLNLCYALSYIAACCSSVLCSILHIHA